MAFGRYVLTADVTIPAGTPAWSASGPATVTSGTTSATPAAGTAVTSQVLSAGTYLLSWTAQLETAAASGDADNFGLYDGTVLLATSASPATIGTYPQAAVSAYLGAGATVAVKNIAIGSSGSVYAASLTVTPVMGGDNRGAVTWTGAGSPPEWTAGPFPVTFLTGTPLWLDSAGPLYAALGAGNLRAWIDGTDNVGHGQWGLSN
jgi:hypothetical protein